MRCSPQHNIWGAAKRGDLEAVREFAERDGIPDVEDDWEPNSLLSVACGAGHADVVRFLRENGAHASRFYGRAPEAFAAMRGGHMEVLRVLCEFGLDPNSKDFSKHGNTLIDQAVKERRADSVRLLLAHGGEIYTGYEDEVTDEEVENHLYVAPIELAARAGNLEFVEFLLEVGVDLLGHDGAYYLEKARDNAPKYEHVRRQKADEELRRQLWRSTPVGGEDVSSFGGCVTLALLVAGVVWAGFLLVGWFGRSFFG